MASITDYVGEGLKYPLSDFKKLLSFGALFAIINIISVAISQISQNSINNIKIESANSFSDAISQITNQTMTQMSSTDIFMITALGIIIFIIFLIILGYQYDVIKFSINRKPDLPGFNDIIGLLVKGIKYFLVSLIYNIIPIILFIISLELVAYESYVLPLMGISGILFIIFNFLLVMALTNMIDSDKIADAFAFKEIINKISNLGWAKYIGIIIFTCIIYMIVMVAVGMIFAGIIVLFTMTIKNGLVLAILIGLISGLFISPYFSVFFQRVYGAIYHEAIK
ncbi:MAG: DUF4013 domain-containing protein [Methanobrevibacter thaueri]|nr:DUF4013 domain-containing protein [Methanobrevibacter thaueri]